MTPEPEKKHFKAKVCLLGEMAVGKSSLVRRFVQGSFDEKYMSTLGVDVSRKAVELPSPGGGPPVTFEMILWDVMGLRGVRESYFHGAGGVLAVCDVTRPETVDALLAWIDDVRRVAGAPPVVIAANKTDLIEDARIDLSDLARVAESLQAEWLPTSARTGANVEEVFRRLAERLRAGPSCPASREGGSAFRP